MGKILRQFKKTFKKIGKISQTFAKEKEEIRRERKRKDVRIEQKTEKKEQENKIKGK